MTAEDILEHAEYLEITAKETFMRDGFLCFLVFLYLENNSIHAFSGAMVPGSKDDLGDFIKEEICQTGAIAVATVTEAWVHSSKMTSDSHILTQLKKGEMSVSNLNPEHKKEVIMISLETKAGPCKRSIIDILRNNDGTPSGFGNTEVIDDAQGRLAGFFK